MAKKLQGLVLESYNKGQLDADTVEFIAGKLNRSELKKYIQLLKQHENEKQVLISVPKSLTEDQHEMMQKLFNGKKIIYTVDPSMIGGIKVIDNDMEYEISLNQIFSDFLTHLERYD